MNKKFLALAAFFLSACLVNPPPTPGPTPVPTPKPTPTPWKPPARCPSIGKINFGHGNIGTCRLQASWVCDATPLTTDTQWCHENGFPDRTNCPLGQEGDDARARCEVANGPYRWTFKEDGDTRVQVCGEDPMTPNDCFLNGGNPLQIKVRMPTTNGDVEICTVRANPEDEICAKGRLQ